MSDPFVAEIRMFAGNFAPTGWAQCNGQLLPISQNTALFSLLGTFYGGDGKSTFALPDLQGSTPIGTGQGAGLEDYFLGQASGTRIHHVAAVRDTRAHAHTSPRTATTRRIAAYPSPTTVPGRAPGLLPYSPSQQHPDERSSAQHRRWESAAQQHVAVPDRQLHHRACRAFSRRAVP